MGLTLPAEYRREVERRITGLSRAASPEPLSEAAMAGLPDPVRR